VLDRVRHVLKFENFFSVIHFFLNNRVQGVVDIGMWSFFNWFTMACN